MRIKFSYQTNYATVIILKQDEHPLMNFDSKMSVRWRRLDVIYGASWAVSMVLAEGEELSSFPHLKAGGQGGRPTSPG